MWQGSYSLNILICHLFSVLLLICVCVSQQLNKSKEYNSQTVAKVKMSKAMQVGFDLVESN